MRATSDSRLRFASAVLVLAGGGLQDAPRTASAAREVDLHAAELEIPFTLDGPRPVPVIEARVNGDGPFRFYFDTGASGCVLDSAFARGRKLRPRGKVQVGDPGPGALDAEQVAFDLSIGEAVWRRLPAVSFDRQRFGASEGIVGVLGLPLASRHLLTLDYGRRRLRLSDESLPEEGPGIARLFQGRLPEIELDVDGKTIRAHLDTGSPSGFTLPTEFVRGLPLKREPTIVGRGRTVSGEFEIKDAQLAGTLHLAGHAFPEAEIRINDRFPIANVGRGVLERFVFSIDQRNLRARFVQAESRPADAPRPARRLGVAFAATSEEPVVENVETGSAAEKAGLRVGDVLLSVDGRPVSSADMSALQKALEGSAAIELVVRRTGKEQKLVVPAE